MTDDFTVLKGKVKELLNFNGEFYNEKHFRRRVGIRMHALGTESYSDYLKVLERNAEEQRNLLKVLTVNVTGFFRNPETFEFVRAKVLPEMMEYKLGKGGSMLRLWSAGCADGKEAYSLAMLVRDVLGGKPLKVRIYATDVDRSSLEKAEKAEYSENEMKGISRGHLKKYFEPQDGSYRLKGEIRRMVSFRYGDLISGKGYSHIDMLMCRNVVIYFSRELKERLFMDFYNSLNPGGFLILGKTENLIGEARRRLSVYNNVERIYRKV